MTLKLILKGLALLGVVLLAAQCTQEPTGLKTEKDKIDYGIGVSVAKNFKRQGIEVNPDLVVKGMKDELAGQKLLMSEDEIRKTMMEFQTALRQKQLKARTAAALDNQKAGNAFLEENKKKEGVVTLPSGLQYKIIKAGAGKKPTENDVVEVNYRGTLISGKEFDKGQGMAFKPTEVIPGWREALKLMPAGSKWQVVVPPQLAYGQQGSGVDIGPNSTLIFEIELLGIKSPEASPPAGK